MGEERLQVVDQLPLEALATPRKLVEDRPQQKDPPRHNDGVGRGLGRDRKSVVEEVRRQPRDTRGVSIEDSEAQRGGPRAHRLQLGRRKHPRENPQDQGFRGILVLLAPVLDTPDQPSDDFGEEALLAEVDVRVEACVRLRIQQHLFDPWRDRRERSRAHRLEDPFEHLGMRAHEALQPAGLRHREGCGELGHVGLVCQMPREEFDRPSDELLVDDVPVYPRGPGVEAGRGGRAVPERKVLVRPP
mmetsp:Transcript_56515/g.134250  ORF Transcript_56515/g.134250 Transcript_56515/m.134250 type:complete len:245 (-) Transcript_56515:1184-1918(-)